MNISLTDSIKQNSTHSTNISIKVRSNKEYKRILQNSYQLWKRIKSRSTATRRFRTILWILSSGTISFCCLSRINIVRDQGKMADLILANVKVSQFQIPGIPDPLPLAVNELCGTSTNKSYRKSPRSLTHAAMDSIDLLTSLSADVMQFLETKCKYLIHEAAVGLGHSY